jgi:hypothetical protein
LIALVRGSWLDPRRLLLVLLPLLGFASYLCVDAQLPKLRRRPTQHELHAHDATARASPDPRRPLVAGRPPLLALCALVNLTVIVYS